VAEGTSLVGKREIVTGGASGIGLETARALASIGADVTLAVRNPAVGAQAASEIRATTRNPNIHAAHLDLADRASIAAFVSAWRGPLHILVNNAGVMACPAARTPEGWEWQFATNHLGHFALTLGLHNALATGGARVVVVSSSSHQYMPVVFDDLQFRFIPYDAGLAYAQSKTANVLHAVGVTERWAGDGITANALMPGAIHTRLQRYVGDTMVSPPERQKTPQQGAATSVLLATSPLLDGIGGRYFATCNEQLVVTQPTADMTGVAPYALDPENADRLWEVSLRLLA
jgi:NAD(P)-dependent dehydrogenase (short-subunit alcohol dehydrogenase family)